MIETHHIQNISFSANTMFITVDGKPIEIMIKELSPKLHAATDIQRNLYKLSPSGYGIHWPLIDEDLSVGAILQKYGR